MVVAVVSVFIMQLIYFNFLDDYNETRIHKVMMNQLILAQIMCSYRRKTIAIYLIRWPLTKKIARKRFKRGLPHEIEEIKLDLLLIKSFY